VVMLLAETCLLKNWSQNWTKRLRINHTVVMLLAETCLLKNWSQNWTKRLRINHTVVMLLAETCLLKNWSQNWSPMAVAIFVPYAGWMHKSSWVTPQSPES